MARGKKQKQEPEPVEELKDAAEEVTAVAAEEPEPEEPAAAPEVPAAAETTEAPKAARKRKADEEAAEDDEETKRNKTLDAALIAEALASDVADAHVDLVLPAKDGLEVFTDLDVLSGRGGGTNSAIGNKQFRDLINIHRRAYLKARKNDKPAISRNIVRQIRAKGGRFLKKDEKSGLWFEIGDDAAREKTSQALRQRAPEMRKLLFDTEREEARLAAQEHLRQQQMFIGDGKAPPAAVPPPMGLPPMPPQGMAFPPFPFPPPGFKMPPMPAPDSEQYRQMFGAFMMPPGGSFPGFPGMPFPMMPPPAEESKGEDAKPELEEAPAVHNEATV